MTVFESASKRFPWFTKSWLEKGKTPEEFNKKAISIMEKVLDGLLELEETIYTEITDELGFDDSTSNRSAYLFLVEETLNRGNFNI